MPFSPTHGVFALAIGSVMAPRPALRLFLIAGAACAVLPDVDLMAPVFQAGSRDLHRTFTHSIFFSVLVGGLGAMCVPYLSEPYRIRLGIYLTLATASHGILDALTTYERGVAFFSPVSSDRYVAPWRPIDGGSVEFWLVLVPCFLFTCLVLHTRGIRFRSPSRDVPLSIRTD